MSVSEKNEFIYHDEQNPQLYGVRLGVLRF